MSSRKKVAFSTNPANSASPAITAIDGNASIKAKATTTR